ncbi:MAG: hypothetical protein L6V93_21075 [Clostridiales bacterium]|nr:MAG: hypothetical protein L6V93_21075 [Clostridiales bacterium]
MNSGSYLSCQVINNGITDNSKVKVFVWEDGKIVPLKGATETTKGAVTGDISDYNDLVVNKGSVKPVNYLLRALGGCRRCKAQQLGNAVF